MTDKYESVIDVCKLSSENESRLKRIAKIVDDEKFDDCKAIPYHEVIKILEFLPYGNPIRVMIMHLFLTGCRPSELDRMQLDNMKISYIKNGFMYWRCGKNQKGQWRKEPLPVSYIRELLYYRQCNRVREGYLFAWSRETLRSKFNKLVRPHLGDSWQLKADRPDCAGIVHFNFQIKGFRKSWATLRFAKLIDQWGGNADVALEFICKAMRHSNKGITVTHYLQDFKALDMDKWKHLEPSDILNLASQKHLAEYDVNENGVKALVDNPQLTLQDFKEIKK